MSKIFTIKNFIFSTLLVFLTSVIFFSCDRPNKVKTTANYNTPTYEELPENADYEDGTYCADIEYYNPRTGTTSDYTLTIEIEDNRLIRIDWPNGGWLDESHFSDVEITEDGEANFESDRGYEYTLRIVGSSACRYGGLFNSRGYESNEEENLEDNDEDVDEEYYYDEN